MKQFNWDINRGLNERDQRIIELVTRGLTNEEVGLEIGHTKFTVKNYMKEIYDKLGLSNRVELALWYAAQQHQKEDSR